MVTGSVGGIVDIWNFKNGAHLAKFIVNRTLTNGNVDLGGICQLLTGIVSNEEGFSIGNDQSNEREVIVASCWNENIYIFEDRRKQIDHQTLFRPVNVSEQIERAHSPH